MRPLSAASWLGPLAFLGFLVGCGDVGEPVGAHEYPLSAYCSAHVNGIGDVDVETDYLPHVVQCENGAADFEALKVQAVTARSYLYYKLETSGSVADGTGDQVYSCGRDPSPDHIRAVEETSGVFLSYEGVTVAAFYVAGAHGTPPECAGDGDDPTNTERWVTYNEGLSGDDINQTELGWVNAGNLRNRGCASQNGADCLAEGGRTWREILPFYYGEDIGIEQATGDCVVPLPEDRPDEGDGDADADTDADTDADSDADADTDADTDADVDVDADADADADGDGDDREPGFDHPDTPAAPGGLTQSGCSVARAASTRGGRPAFTLLALVALFALRRPRY